VDDANRDDLEWSSGASAILAGMEELEARILQREAELALWAQADLRQHARAMRRALRPLPVRKKRCGRR
jgi:hypothetical protein